MSYKKKARKIYSKYKGHASKGINIATILALLGGVLDLFNEHSKDKDTNSKLWTRISEEQKQISDLDKRLYLVEHGVSIYQNKSMFLNNINTNN